MFQPLKLIVTYKHTHSLSARGIRKHAPDLTRSNLSLVQVWGLDRSCKHKYLSKIQIHAIAPG